MKKLLTIIIFFLLVVLSSFSIYKYYLLKTENNTLNQKLGTIQKIQSDTSDDALDYYKKLSIRAVEILDEKSKESNGIKHNFFKIVKKII